MSRTACCFLALGIGVTLAAACSDDDVDSPGVGGSAGRGGAAGAAGSGGGAGESGAAGNGGSPGTGGTGGSNAGTGGAGGSSAGTGGTGATGGSEGDPDGGVDASTPDGGGGTGGGAGDGVGSGPCPNFATAAGDIEEQDGQVVVIARVVFNGDGSADVVLRNPLPAVPGDAGATNFPLIEPRALCSGANNCEFLEDICDDDDGDILSGEEVTCTISDTGITEGEVGLLSDSASVPGAFVFAYVQWDIDNNFVSVPPSVGGGENLEARAVASGSGFWGADQTIAVDADDDAIVATGDSITASDFESCELP